MCVDVGALKGGQNGDKAGFERGQLARGINVRNHPKQSRLGFVEDDEWASGWVLPECGFPPEVKGGERLGQCDGHIMHCFGVGG